MSISLYWFFIPLALIVAAGAGAAVYSIRRLLESLQARGWPQAQGRILRLERKVIHNEGPDSHEIMVTYQYQVEGRDYQSTRISRFYRASSELDVHHQLKQKLANARTLTVYYKPGQPQCSMLAPGYHKGVFTSMGVSLILASFCLIFALLVGHSQLKGSYIQAIQVVQP